MALGKEETEAGAPADTDTDGKARACGSTWSFKEQELPPQGPGPEPEPPVHLEAEGQPARRAGPGAGLSCGSGVFLPRARTATSEPGGDGSESARVGTGDLWHSLGSQGAIKMEASKLSASQELLQRVGRLRAAAACSGPGAGSEDDGPLGLSGHPHVSGFPLLSQCSSARLSVGSVSASSVGSSLQEQQGKAQPQSGSSAEVSSLDLVVPQSPSVVGPGARRQWSSQPGASVGDACGPGRRRLSFQAEYWACVLPDSLPPSPDRHSPLWNPNKEYEELLDYTYPLRPGPPLPRHSDPVMQDSGIDLDSFSVSPASTLKSPTNVSPNCSPAEAATLPFSGAKKSSLMFRPLGVPQKPGSPGLEAWGQPALTPGAPGSGGAAWESRAAATRATEDRLPLGTCLKRDCPQVRTRGSGRPLPRPEREKRAGQSAWRPTCAEPAWKSEEELERDDEYLALPARLARVSSLVSCTGAMPTFVRLPTGAAQGLSSLEGSDSDGPASPTLASSHRHCPSGAVIQGPEGQNPCFLRPRDSTGESSLASPALGPSCGLPRTQPSPALSTRWPLSEPHAGGQQKASLVQCVQTFCCQLEELIRWLYNVTDVPDLGSPPRSGLPGLKSSLQLYRQFKKDVDEHQSLTESVLEKGDVLLRCLLDNTPVLKDVLGRIAKQSGELESHADRLYDSILSSLDMLAGCTLVPDASSSSTGTPL